MIRNLCRSLRGAGICAMAVLVISGSFAEQGQAADKTPPVPFEKLYAAERGDGKYLSFNVFSGEIPGKRIKALLRSGQVVGDRILLAEDVAVYFPDGYIVQSQVRFGKYIPRAGLIAGAVAKRDHLVENPRYALVEQFDQILGKECARTEYANGFAALRIKSDGVMSLVMETAGLYDPLVNEATTTYTVTSAVQPVFIGNQGLVPDLMKICGRG
ncbi:hypothetical protein AUP42_01100 [Thalassospira lucentensis]|jgi:hypothetical protein|uniref:Uncharacterized protein n=2 Tax=Thalassospira TaxID=168934 RepID=A0A285RGG5_9PROT|nr:MULTISPECIES: hypothetical protein [Thalassospira]KZB64532.1 hypothetical protein AUP42_01100 [Thalassospira lucentensis]MAZ33322.1 hypothetical protein [Thalassospira sp.]MBO9509727.1 hypothetical protein [Thalassospira sp. A3_1]MCH2274569.1 hypothetical protein [Thalassospira sp.]MCK2165805.1 hypothetical protein [Thalassospira xiamenensis]